MAIDLTKFTKGKNFLSTDFNFDDPSDKISVKTDAASSVGAAIAAAVPVGATAAETIAGTDDTKFLSPADLKAAVGSGAAYKIDVATDATIHGVTVGLGGGSGTLNTVVGPSSGSALTTGSNNTIIGGFSGNQGGLDIRTASNYIVLSDGQGNPSGFCRSDGQWFFGNNARSADGQVAFVGNAASNEGPSLQGYTGTYGALSASRWACGSNSTIKGGTAYDTFTVTAGAGNAGGVSLTAAATAWISASDSRLKNITGEYENALADIAQIKAVKFTWKEDENNKPQVGVIAQSVQNVVPEAIDIVRASKEDETEYLGVRYTELIPLMIASIQELSAKNDALEARLSALEAK